MSAKLDVLAVLDEWTTAKALLEHDFGKADRIAKVRAAVAALIAERDTLREALIRLEEAARAVQAGEWDRNSIQIERDAAIAALRQQPAPVDLEQFRLPVEAWKSHLDPNDDDESEAYDEADRLLSIIDNAGEVAPACEVRLWDSQWVNIVNAPEVLDASDREEAVNAAVRMTERAIAQNVASSNLPPAPHQPAPVGDDAAKHWHDLYRKECRLRQDDAARYGQKIEDLEAASVVDDAHIARALEWVRELAKVDTQGASEHLPAIEEAIAAYDPNCGALTVGVVDDAMRALAANLVDEVDGLIGESGGVYGLHLNGDQSPWDELLPGGRFERLTSLDDLRAALARAQGVQS